MDARSPTCPHSTAHRSEHSNSAGRKAVWVRLPTVPTPRTSRRRALPAGESPGIWGTRTVRRAHANLLTKASAVSATSRHPLSIVSECPRPSIFTISVTASFRFSLLYDAFAIAHGTV